MEKFKMALRGYDVNEVNQFLDQVINQVEGMVNDIKERDAQILKLEGLIVENNSLQDKLNQYERMESTLNKAILMAQKTSDQIRSSAQKESSIIIEDAKKNASRIINEALLRAEKTDLEASMLQRNVKIFKKRLRDIIETQLKLVEEIDKVEL